MLPDELSLESVEVVARVSRIVAVDALGYLGEPHDAVGRERVVQVPGRQQDCQPRLVAQKCERFGDVGARFPATDSTGNSVDPVSPPVSHDSSLLVDRS